MVSIVDEHTRECLGGLVERFHQTLKKHLRAQRPAATIAELQHQIDGFLAYYNSVRPFLGLADLLCDVA